MRRREPANVITPSIKSLAPAAAMSFDCRVTTPIDMLSGPIDADVMFAASVTHVILRAQFVICKAKIADTKMLIMERCTVRLLGIFSIL